MAPAIAVAAAPTAPSPPMIPVAGKPASTSLFSKSAGPTTPPATADSATDETAAPAAPERPAPRLWNPSETFAGLFKPAAAADRGDRPRGQSQPTTSRPPAAATGAASPSGTAGSQRRFDPDLGAAGLVVSDARPGTPADRPAPQDDAEFLGSAPTFPAPPATSPEPQAKESVSLVSWLSQSYSELVGSDGFGGGEGIADAGSGVCVTDCCCPTWQVQVDALFFWQGNIPSRPLYVYTDTQATALDANQLQNRAAIAPRYAVIYNRDDCRAVEVNYFAVWGFNAVQQVGSPEFPVVDSTGAGAISAAGLLGTDISGIGFARATSTAHIKSFEANLRRRQEDGFIQWISGFRWIEWGQTLALEDTIYNGNVPVAFDSFELSTINNLYGWQLGGDATLWNAGRWVRINGVGKAGIYYNHQANQNSAYFNGFDPPTGYAEAKDVVSFVGETGINASVALTKWLSWRAGYSFFWLGGVATPTRQLTQTDVMNGTTAVNATGSVFLQAATTGLEARW